MISVFLKEQTKQHHDETEERLQSQKIFDKSYTLEDYKKLLIHNYNLVSVYEPQINKWLSKYPELKLDLRKKTEVLKSDLEKLNIKIEAINISETLENEAQAFGALYVMEGSTLGGNVIAKQLKKNPAFDDVEINYFGMYGAQTVILWSEFKAIIDRVITEENYHDCVTGAKKAYRILA